MIEMRWYLPASSKTAILQYRQQYDATVRAGTPNMITWPTTATNMQWSEWKNVPLVTERDPSCP